MVEIKRASDNSRVVFTAYDKTEQLGFIEGDIEITELVVRRIGGEGIILDGLCRAALNAAENDGCVSCRFELPESEMKAVYALGIVKSNEKNISDIQSFFRTHKNCRH